MAKLTRTTLAIDSDMLDKFDAWMGRHGYGNRSQAVRDLMKAALVQDEWADPMSEVVGALSIVYDHSHALAQELTDMQHEDFHAVLCSQHVHLDHDRCLEVILMRGTAGQLRRISDAIVATKGVIAGKLTLMSLTV